MSSNKKINPKNTHSQLSVEEKVIREFQRIKLKGKTAAKQQEQNNYLTNKFYYGDESQYDYGSFEEEAEHFEEMFENEEEEEFHTSMKGKCVNRWVREKKSSNKRYCKAFSQKGQ